MNIVVLDGYTLNPGDITWDALAALGNLTVYDRTSIGDIVDRARDAEMVLSNKTVMDKDTIENLPNLKYIGVLATGYNTIDVVTARNRGIVVANVPAYGTSSVAQMVFALLLELCLQVKKHDQAVKDGEWTNSPDFCLTKSPLVELDGKTLGILGFGTIGQKVAEIGMAFGMNIIHPRRNKPETAHHSKIKQVSLEALFAESDVLSLHCPLTPETAGIINKRNIELMKKEAFLISG